MDSHTGAAVLALLKELQAEEGAALLLATHDEAIAAAADRVIHLRDGRILDRGGTLVAMRPDQEERARRSEPG